jgi:hypothetical protein
MTASRLEADGFSTRRVVRLATALVVFGALLEMVFARSLASAASLTLSGAVAIINFHWLEVVLVRVVQAGKPHYDRAAVLRIVGRLGLLAGLLTALVMVPQVDPVAVAIGFSTLVVALVVEGLRGVRGGGG